MEGRPLAKGIDANLVAGTLYQGSAPDNSPLLRKKVDAICFAAWEYQPRIKAKHLSIIRARLDDSGMPMLQRERAEAVWAANKVRTFLDKGAIVLVTCVAGLNRSGLVCALSLMLATEHSTTTPSCLTSRQAIKAVRRARGPRALSNDYFLAFLESMDSFRSLCGSTW